MKRYGKPWPPSHFLSLEHVLTAVGFKLEEKLEGKFAWLVKARRQKEE